jgi:phosphatidylserine decarboxylase
MGATPLRARVAAAVIDVSPDWYASAVSRIMGAAARLRLPDAVGRAVVSAYVRYYDVDLNDVDPLALDEGFESFDAFFTRPLRSGARPFARGTRTVVSPCDGTIRDVVTVEAGAEIVAKGHPYTLGELLADEDLAGRFVGGQLASVYLHPRDYHRVHSPCDALVRRVSLVPGRLLPVTAASVRRQPRVFALNERMIHVFETGHGMMALVMIAAFGVGNMTCAYHRFSPHARELQVHECDPPVRLNKGDQLGVFHLGSTVLLLAEKGLLVAHDDIPGRIRVGSPLLEGQAD